MTSNLHVYFYANELIILLWQILYLFVYNYDRNIVLRSNIDQHFKETLKNLRHANF